MPESTTFDTADPVFVQVQVLQIVEPFKSIIVQAGQLVVVEQHGYHCMVRSEEP